MGVVGSLNLAVAFGRNDDLSAAFSDPFGKMIDIVSLVGEGRAGVDAIDQIMGKRDVVSLSGRGDQANGKTKGLGGGMDFSAQAAARPAQALGIRPPLTLRAPAACW